MRRTPASWAPRSSSASTTSTPTCFPGSSAAASDREVGEAFRRLRACYPHRRLYVIIDNLHQVHDHPRFLELCRKVRITLVFTPTEASWLNLIEPHFGVLHRATVAGSDDREHVVRRRRVYRYLRLRHRKLGKAAHPLTRIRMVKPVKLGRH